MISSKQAYICCFWFLDEIWEINRALYDDDLPGLLGDMQMTADGIPFDFALKNDWNKAMLNQEEMSIEGTFESMLRFLKIYVDLGEADTKDVTRVLQHIESNRLTAFARWIELAGRLEKSDDDVR